MILAATKNGVKQRQASSFRLLEADEVDPEREQYRKRKKGYNHLPPY